MRRLSLDWLRGCFTELGRMDHPSRKAIDLQPAGLPFGKGYRAIDDNRGNRIPVAMRYGTLHPNPENCKGIRVPQRTT